jgi:hypothetical protein
MLPQLDFQNPLPLSLLSLSLVNDKKERRQPPLLTFLGKSLSPALLTSLHTKAFTKPTPYQPHIISIVVSLSTHWKSSKKEHKILQTTHLSSTQLLAFFHTQNISKTCYLKIKNIPRAPSIKSLQNKLKILIFYHLFSHFMHQQVFKT